MTISLEAGLALLITDLLDSAELDLNAASATIELTAKNRLITRAATQIDTAVRVRELLEAYRPLPGDFEALSVSESNEKADTFHVAHNIDLIRALANGPDVPGGETMDLETEQERYFRQMNKS